MSLDVCPHLLFFLKSLRSVCISFSIVWLDSSVKVFGLGHLFFGRFLIIKFFLLVISLFRFFFPSWFSLSRLLVGTYPFLLGCPVCWPLLDQILLGSFVFLWYLLPWLIFLSFFKRSFPYF